MTLDEVTGVIRVKINGKDLTLDGNETNDDLKRLAELSYNGVGKYMVDLEDKQPVGTDADTVDGADLEDGHEYEFGYYKVPHESASTVLTGMTVTMTAPAADVYAKAGDEVTLTITIGGTAAAATAQTLTIANATFKGSDGDALTATGTPSGMTSAVRTNGTTLTFTPTAAAVSGVYSATIVVGSDDVTITMPA